MNLFGSKFKFDKYYYNNRKTYDKPRITNNHFYIFISGRTSSVKSISSTNNAMSTTGGTRGGGSGTNSTSSMHLTTSKQEPLTSIVVIKTETGSLNSGNIMGVSDEVT